MIKSIIPTFIPVLFILQGFSQQDGEKWLKSVREIYQRIHETGSDEGGGHFHLNYTVYTIMNNEQIPDVTQTVDLVTDGDKTRMITPEMQLYTDKSEAVTLFPGKQVMYLSGIDPKEKRIQRLHRKGILQDSVFGMSVLRACYDTEDNGKTYKKIVIGLSARGQQKFFTKSIAFYLDTTALEIKKILIEYTRAKSPVAVQIYQFNALAYDVTGVSLKSVREMFFNTEGGVLPAYRRYKIVDVR